jgi:GrpB-like predicted nucleotidyltransferase (UPF0157 family)
LTVRSHPAYPVEIAEHDPRWKEEFARAREEILGAIGPQAEAVEHVGSTSVPGLAAKPIVDILVGVRRFPLAVEQIDALCALGYSYHGESGIPGRQYFNYGWPRTRHLHAFAHRSPEFMRHVVFRDYLRAHPVEAKEYEALKRSLAGRFREDREAYTSGKTEFVRSMEEKAFAWAGLAGQPRQFADGSR